ncbi:MAG TPA: flagellar biosynthetic protein FliR [Terriglobales bacterium]|nr:flagellar biosynthetic protein FliR [Terriglobales bacterium]
MLDLEKIVTAAVFTGARVAGLLTFAPFLGSVVIPMRVKAGLVVLVTYLIYPLCAPHVPEWTASNWLQIAVTELFTGLLIGLVVSFVFEAAQLAGQIVGIQVGFSLVNVMDPQTQVDTPVVSTFFQLLVILIFLQLNVHHWLLRGVINSFSYLPTGQILPTGPLTQALMNAAGAIFVSAVQIAAPVLFVSLVIDVALGFIGKASPQLPVLFMGLSVKTLLGFAIMIATLSLWPGRFERYFAQSISTAEHLLHLPR